MIQFGRFLIVRMHSWCPLQNLLTSTRPCLRVGVYGPDPKIRTDSHRCLLVALSRQCLPTRPSLFAVMAIHHQAFAMHPRIVFALRIATTWHPLGFPVGHWLVLRQLFKRTGPLVVLLAHRGGNYPSPGCLLQYRPHCVPAIGK